MIKDFDNEPVASSGKGRIPKETRKKKPARAGQPKEAKERQKDKRTAKRSPLSPKASRSRKKREPAAEIPKSVSPRNRQRIPGKSAVIHRRPRVKVGLWARVSQYMSEMSAGDRIIASTGVVIIAMAAITGSILWSVKNKDAQMEQFTEVGQTLHSLGADGESALVCAIDRQLNGKSDESEEAQETETKESEEGIQLVLNLTSVSKDLKIKIINQESNALVSGMDLKVEVTDPDQKTNTYSDDDKDGIIYRDNLKAGEYQVSLVDSEALEKYEFSTAPVQISVKDKITYQAVDVKNEIKKESQVNIKEEDTERRASQEGLGLKDTVKFTESKKEEEIKSAGEEKSEETKPEDQKGGENKADENKSEKNTSDDEFEEVEAGNIADPSQTSKAGSSVRPLFEALETESDEEDDDEDEEDDDGLDVILDSSGITLNVGDETTITADCKGEDGNAEFEFSSDNEKVVRADQFNEECDLTALSPGTATIKVTAKDAGGNKGTAVCTVTVKGEAKDDNTTPLRDTEGYQLYYKNEDGDYVAATYADYYKYDKFFRKKSDAPKKSEEKEETPGETSYKYTGWQTIDGKTYYYDENGIPVTGEQVILGAKYNFDENGVLKSDGGYGTMGIDVSKWNGTIDWSTVKNSGVNYAIIRCGFRGSATGVLVEDSAFASNLKNAKAAGLKTGVYFFTQAVNEVEAVEEASMVLGQLGGAGIDFPVFVDTEESGGRGDGIDKTTRTAVVNAFCQTIRNGGYTAGVYSNKEWFEQKLTVSSLTDYKIWLAQYTAEPTYTASRYDIWQYSNKGTINGIPEKVDLNINYHL